MARSSATKVATTLNMTKKNYDTLSKQALKLNISKTRLIELALDNLFKTKKLELLVQ